MGGDLMKKEKDKKKKRKLQDITAAPAKKDDSEVLQPKADPLQYLTAVAGGKWKLRILWALREQKSRRYGEIKLDIPGITDMMLSQSLRELSADGLISRIQFQEIPPRVEYRLTEAGAEIIPALTPLVLWASRQAKRAEPI